MVSEHPPSPPDLNYRVVTFYSYKGGVGRSMALANVATLLAEYGRRVLIVDFDLEAPGLHRYFEQRDAGLEIQTRRGAGLAELIDGYRRGKPLDWRRCVTKIRWPASRHGIHMIAAAGERADYSEIVQDLNWDELFRKHEFGNYLCRLREEWREEYDVVLVDSRTGMSDIGGICTILLPDALVVLFTANEQSIEGTVQVVRRARAAQETLPVERGRLLAIPILSRDDRRTEYEQSARWRHRIADAMGDFFSDWVWKEVSPQTVLQKLYLPQIAYWSFGERLPVLERRDELDDVSSLGAAYRRVARLIDSDFDWKVLDSEREPPGRKTAELEGEARRLMLMVRVLAVGLLLMLLLLFGLTYFFLAAEKARNDELVEAQQIQRELLRRQEALIQSMNEERARRPSPSNAPP